MKRKISTAGTNADAWPSPWVISYGGGTGSATIQSNGLQLVTPVVGDYGGSARALYAYPMDNFDFQCRIIPGQVWQNGVNENFPSIGIGDKFSTTGSGVDNGFYLSLGPLTNQISVGSTIATVATNSGSGSFTYNSSNNLWIKIRRKGYWVGMKIWEDGSAEPGDWTLGGAATGSSTVTPLYPYIACNTGFPTVATTYTFDSITLDDLQVKRRRLR